jgi:hypothetical protein
MKRTLQSLILAGALGAMPALTWADPLEDTLNDQQVGQILNNSGPTGQTNFGPRSESGSKDASGILFHNGSAYMMQKLGTDLSLPNGTRVQPNGTILEHDGSQKMMSSGQILSLDGQIKMAPFSGLAESPSLVPQEESNPSLEPFQNSPPGVSDSFTTPIDRLSTDNGDFSD